MRICGKDIKVQGRLLRIAHVEGDKYKFLDDPGTLLDGLRKSGKRIDLFTFMQGLPVTTPKFNYPMEWDNFAALSLTTFDDWWMKTLDNKTRNKARQAEKKGVTLREVPFDDALIRGICEIYNETPFGREGDSPTTELLPKERVNMPGRFSTAAFSLERFLKTV